MNETDIEDIARRAGFIETPDEDVEEAESADGLAATLKRFLGLLGG